MKANRFRLLLAMLLLLAVIAAVVRWASPYAPVVQPVRDMEEIWAIEDSRRESEEPLLTALENNGVALGYDREENTFYCTLGLNNTDIWPQIHLTAPDAGNLQICFVDDYGYDWCSEAIRENYAYQLLAYNDELYSYAQIVFTGMPILRMTTKEEVPAHEDVPVVLTWSYDGQTKMESYARTHKRGASTLFFGNPKVGFKTEFTRGANGMDKVQAEVETLGMTDEFVLIPCLNTEMMQDRLCWDLYGMMNSADQPFGRRDMFYTELFINDEYLGVFLVMKPFDYETELSKASRSAPETDSIYRTIVVNDLDRERPIYVDKDGMDYEVYYTNKPAGHEFEPLMPFIAAALNADRETKKANRAFRETVEKQFNIDSFLRYFLFVQACGLKDNLINNMYIWAKRTPQGYEYHLKPWDLNVSWGGSSENYEDQKWTLLPLFDRAIELDCTGLIRERMLEIWQEMRQEVFTAQTVEKLVQQYTDELQESGAFYRDAGKWEKSEFYPDGYNICAYAQLRFDMLDKRIEEMASDALKGRLLKITEYETLDMGMPAN